MNLRAADKSYMKKEFFKLIINSIYGKTCKKQSKHTDIRLLTDTVFCQKLSCKTEYKGFRIFNDHLAGLTLKKVTIPINKPFYVWFADVELRHLLRLKYVE